MADVESDALCFFCASELTSGVRKEQFSLKQVFYFLNVDWKQVVGGDGNGNPPPGGGAEYFEKDKLSVVLCNDCSSAAGNFTNLCEELEVIQALIEQSTDKLFNLIVVDREQDKEPEDDLLNTLRKKTKNQCLKLLAASAKPQVLLKRMESKNLLFPGEPIKVARRDVRISLEDDDGDSESSESDSEDSEEYMDVSELDDIAIEHQAHDDEKEGDPLEMTLQEQPSSSTNANVQDKPVESNALEVCLGCGIMVRKSTFLTHISYYCQSLRTKRRAGIPRIAQKDRDCADSAAFLFATPNAPSPAQAKYCPICEKKFCSNSSLHLHRQKIHPEQYFLSCKPPSVSMKRFTDLCAIVFKKEKSLLKRVEMEDGKRSFECSHCSGSIGNHRYRAPIHFITAHYQIFKKKVEQVIPGNPSTVSASNDPTTRSTDSSDVKTEVDEDSEGGIPPTLINTSEPTRKFVHQSSSFHGFNQPESQHTPKKLEKSTKTAATAVFKCESCDSPFISRSSLATHMRLKHPGKKISMKNLLSGTAPAVLTQFPCKLCHHSCSTSNDLAMHMKTSHAPVEKETVKQMEQTPSPSENISCPHCNMTFISEIGAAAHIKKGRCLKFKESEDEAGSPAEKLAILNELVKEELQDDKEDEDREDSMFQCNYCSQGFNSVTSLLCHTRKEHSSAFTAPSSGT